MAFFFLGGGGEQEKFQGGHTAVYTVDVWNQFLHNFNLNSRKKGSA